MDFEDNYEITRTATFIRTRKFSIVALQFPDDLLKDATRVVRALYDKLRCSGCETSDRDVRLYVMADTTYGSCCVDEVGAAHINAHCVIHYGHTCLSPTSTLPALYIFGKAPLSISNCAENLKHYASTNTKPVLVLFGLEYSYAIPDLRETLEGASLKTYDSACKLNVVCADVTCSVMEPSGSFQIPTGCDVAKIDGLDGGRSAGSTMGTRYINAGLSWSLPREQKMEDYSIYWIGPDNSAFANVVLTYNGCEIVRYDAVENHLVTDVSVQRRILKRRYYLVEKAKDANIIGILVGTLGVAGYLHMINQMKDLITRAGKKAYTLAMGKPNPAKLANFPECDVFVYVSCAQTALLDSKDFLAPVITPFEAMIAFSRGSQWTGDYIMEFKDLMASSAMKVENLEEAKFSFILGGYVEDSDVKEASEEDEEGTLALVKQTEKALTLRDQDPRSVIKGTAKSGAEYFALRTFQGLEIPSENSSPGPVLLGRTGKASGYADEKIKDEKLR